MQTIFSISIFISMICVGIRLISGKGMIFFFLYKPYLKLKKEEEELLAIRDLYVKKITNSLRHITNLRNGHTKVDNQSITDDETRTKAITLLEEDLRSTRGFLLTNHKGLKSNRIAQVAMKPLIGCLTCMASVWTLMLFPLGFLITMHEIPLVSTWLLGSVLIMPIVAAFNTIIIGAYDLIIAKQKCNC